MSGAIPVTTNSLPSGNAARETVRRIFHPAASGQTAVFPLAAGWKIRLTVSRAAFPDGKEFVVTGIAPDIPIVVRVEDVLAGRDAALDRARAYLTDTGG